jgi:hypothetical protein
MGELPLLLSSAKTGVIVKPEAGEWGKKPSTPMQTSIRVAAMVAGLAVVLVGAVDLMGRYAPQERQERDNVLTSTAFAPALVAFDPQVLRLPFATTTAVEPFLPARLRIPSLSIDARVESVGVKENGAMQNPSNFVNVGWYRYGALPGEAGNTSTMVSGSRESFRASANSR